MIVGGLDRDICLDQGLPLANERAQLVRGEIEAMEVGQAVGSLHLIDSKFDLSVCVVLIFLQV